MNLNPLLSIVDSGQVGTDPVNAAELRSDIDALKKFVDEIETLLNNADKSRTLVDDLPDSSWDGHLIGRRARYDDTTVIGPDLLESQNLKERAGRLFESDRILIVPRDCKPPIQPKCILLAWDSSVECTRAAHEVCSTSCSVRKKCTLQSLMLIKVPAESDETRVPISLPTSPTTESRPYWIAWSAADSQSRAC